MTKNQLKIMQTVGIVIIYIIMWSYNFSKIAQCLFILLIVFVITLDTTLKYITQWKTKKCIENKKEFAKDIFFEAFMCVIMITPVILK